MTSTMRFVGVSTGQSSIMRIFPVWSRMLDLDSELVGLDLPVDAPPEAYRTAMRQMRADPTCVGALVTTHKIALLEAARDQFDELDPFAAAVGEVSSIAFRDGRTIGSAKDPITAGLALEEVLSPDHFRNGGHVLCLGAGGAGTAIGWYLAQRPDLTTPMTFIDVDRARLDGLQAVVQDQARHLPVRTMTPDEVDMSAVLSSLPPGSLIINATGLGKDRPGNPLPDEVRYPEGAVVWELNYRGTLEFLHQARAQAASRNLTVVDGWRYFIHGWTQVIADVYQVELTQDIVAELSTAAKEA